jgi:DNA repair exonuclease SbcCD nuclease subunit
MKRLFDRAIVFGDIHFGNKNNSSIFNDDCEEYIDWLLKVKDKVKADTCIFLGDWFHNRRFVNVQTLDYSMRNLEKLNSAFDQIFMLMGNHDLYYKERRDISSLNLAKNYSNVVLFDEIREIGDCLFVPWLINDEWKKIKEYSKKYVFGHFEIPRFLMNSYVEMPDKNELNEEHFSRNEFVFSGHFHKRQRRGNILYIGNCFPHNYSDVDDTERGLVILEWNKEPKFVNWKNMPFYTKINLSEALNKEFANIVRKKTYMKLLIDIDLSFEESLYLKEKLMEDYKCREVQLIPMNLKTDELNFENFEVKTVDQVVIEGLKNLKNVESNYNVDFLIEIYEELNIDDERKNV